MPSDTYTLTIADAGVSTPADGSVTTVKIADYNVAIAGTGVTTAKIVDGAVTSAKILNGTIVADDLATDSVVTAKVANLNITTDKLAADAVTTAKITNANVTADKLASNSVTNAKILNANVTEDKLANGAVTYGKFRTIPANSILGNSTGATAIVENKTCNAFGFDFLSSEDLTAAKGKLGLGSMATQASTAVAITGGTISNVTLSGTTVSVSSPSGILPTANGGTGRSTYTAGDMIYASGGATLSTLPKGAANLVLHGSGGGSLPAWGLINLATDVTGILPTINGGTGGATTDTLTFATTGLSTDALATGEMRWNGVDKTLDLKLAGDVTLQVGQETNIYVHNSDSVTIPNGSVVYVYGADGDNPAVKLAANANSTASKTLGVATQSITAGSHGYITTQGLVRGLDTSAFSSGDSLWLGVGGALTVTEPVFPATPVRVAIVVRDDVALGSIFVQPQLFSDGRVSGSFRWAATGTGAGASSSGGHTIVGLTSTSSVIIQEQGATPVGSMYSVVCSTDSFTVYARADSGNSATGTLPLKETMFSYIAFI